MGRSGIALIALFLAGVARADQPAPEPSVQDQLTDFANRTGAAIHQALDDPNGKSAHAKSKSKGKAASNAPSGNDDLTKQLNEVGDRIHDSVQSALQPDGRARPKRKAATRPKADAKADLPPPPPGA